MAGAAERLSALRGRGVTQLEALFLEQLPADAALSGLDGRDDALSVAQRVVLLHGVGDGVGAARAMRGLGEPPAGIAAVLAAFPQPTPPAEEEPPARDVSAPRPPAREPALAHWLTNVRAWREVLGV